MPLNYAANFSGSNYLNIANYTGNPAAFSVSCWVNPTASQASRIFFSDYTGWAVGISDGTANQLKFFLGSNTLFQSGTIASNSWTHAVFTWDGTTAKIYLAGNTTPNATLTSGVAYGSVPASNYIGSLNGSIQDFNGRLAGVGYWSKALSTTEVAALYNGGVGLAVADLSGTLLTLLGSYHDFLDGTSLGTDGSGNGRNFTNTGSVAQAFGPAGGPYPDYAGRTQRPGRGVPQGRWARGLTAAVTMPSYGAARIADDAAPGTTFPAAGTIAWGRNAWGPCLAPNDATGQGCVNFGAIIPAGATEFTLVALASLDTTAGALNRELWGAEGPPHDLRVVLNSGLLQFQVGADGAFPNLTVDPPRLGIPLLITARLAAGGVRSLWYGPLKVAERTDALAAYGSNGDALGLGSPASAPTSNWSGQINAGLIWTRALSDAEIVALAADVFAPVRPARMSPAILSAANPPSDFLPYGRWSALRPTQLPTADLTAYLD